MIKHFLSLASFSADELQHLLKRTQFFFLKKNQPDQINHLLKNKIFANVFYEPSTRTRCSFEIAGKRLGADVVNFVPETSSVKKGETVYDTLKTLESLGVDAIVFRHADDHVFDGLQNRITLPLLNAGAGKNEHPSQGMLDLFTLWQEFEELKGLKVAVCGDVKHSRVAGSLMVVAEKFDMEIHLCGPEDLLPNMNPSCIKKSSFDEIIPHMDAVMMLRIQFERHEGLDLDQKTYLQQFGLTLERVKRMKENAIILHPGPFNRGVEIGDEVIEHPKSRIFRQMANGVFVRMALLEWTMAGGSK